MDWTKPRFYRAEGCWACSYMGRGAIWRNEQDFRKVIESAQIWMANVMYQPMNWLR